jgi:hypothetical protein
MKTRGVLKGPTNEAMKEARLTDVVKNVTLPLHENLHEATITIQEVTNMKEVENQTAGDMIHKFHIKKVIEEMTHQFQLKSRKNQLVMMNKVSDVHNTMKGLQDGMSNHIQKIDHQDLLSRDAKAPEVKMLKQPTTSMANKLKMKKKKKHPSKSKNPTLVYQEN